MLRVERPSFICKETRVQLNFQPDVTSLFAGWFWHKNFPSLLPPLPPLRKGDKYYLETYLDDVKLLFSADFCVVKAKCYRSMRKTEAPHSLRIVLDGGEVGTEAATQCSCKAGTGKCQHLATLFTQVMAKLRDDDSPTSHLYSNGIDLEALHWNHRDGLNPSL